MTKAPRLTLSFGSKVVVAKHLRDADAAFAKLLELAIADSVAKYQTKASDENRMAD